MQRRILTAVAVLTIAACMGETRRTIDDLTGTHWVLRTLAGEPVDVTGAVQTPALEIRADAGDTTVTGHGGCNAFRGTCTVRGAAITFGPLASTRMACPALDLETRLFATLDRVTRWELHGRTLVLADPAGEVARFAPADE